MGHKRLFLKASFIIGVAVMLSKVFGLVREQYALYLFGANWELDAYVSASKIPNVFRNLLGEGAFSAVFISIFSGMYAKNKEKALAFANKVISYLLSLCLVVTVLGILGAPFYLKLIHKATLNFDLVIELTYYIMPFLTFISLAAIMMGILNSWDIYFIPALAPFFGNLVFLATVYFLNKSMGVRSLALAFLFSSITYVLVQLPLLFKKKFHFRFNFTIDADLKSFFKYFSPVAFGMAVFQLNRIIANIFSSSIEGGNTLFEKAFIITQLVLSVLITGISTVALPLIAREKDKTSRMVYYLDSLKLTFLMIFPTTIFCATMGYEISSFVYKDILVFLGAGTGKVSEAAISGIGSLLLYFSPAITFFGLITIINRGFQGLKLFYYPVIGSTISVVSNYFLMDYFVPLMGISGLSVAIAISSFLNLITLFYFFSSKNQLEYGKFFLNVSKSILSGTGLFFFLIYSKNLPLPNVLKTPLLIFLGLFVYLLLLLLFREQESKHFVSSIMRKLGLKRKRHRT